MAFDIQEELKKLPGKPGVYLMHDADDTIIYVGKAISLKNRVRQYFQTSRNKGPKIERMVTHIARFEYIVTDSELEALVLECNLIKEHRPKYNTMLKDDKAYPYIKVTVNEDFPRILFSHQMKKDKAKYFGPYTSAGAVKDTIELLRKLYDIRSCNKSLPKEIGKDRPCLYYHIHQCKAPCQGYISKEEYGEQIKKAISFLNGNYNDMIKELTGKMTEAAEEMRFEQAAEYRDLIDSVRRIGERQKITNSNGDIRRAAQPRPAARKRPAAGRTSPLLPISVMAACLALILGATLWFVPHRSQPSGADTALDNAQASTVTLSPSVKEEDADGRKQDSLPAPESAPVLDDSVSSLLFSVPAESSADSTTLHISDRKTIEALSALLVRTQPVQPLDADRTPLCVLEETSADGVTTRVTVWCDGKDVVFVSSTDTQYYRVPDAAAEFCRLTGLPEN